MPYAIQVMPSVPRALAMLDQDPASRTFGCWDRAFWLYRTLTNLAGSTWQQLMLPLAVIHDTARPDNPWAGDRTLLKAAMAGLEWWSRIQHPDGSFDEWYLNEHSYCPTAFTSAAAVQTVNILNERMPGALRERAMTALERAGTWLAKRYNPSVMNQNLAAALTLYGLAKITGSPQWLRAAEEKYDRLKTDQHPEGWFSEYGGADLGYSTLALDMLASADALKPHELVRYMGKRLVGFLASMQGCGPGLAGRLGSRGTSHVFPYGAEHFATQFPDAAVLASRWRAAYAGGELPGPEACDDRYFAYFYFPQFALAYARADDLKKGRAPDTGELDLSGSGFYIKRGQDWSVIISRCLGGACAVETPGRPPAYHLGYQARTRKGKLYSSAHWYRRTIQPVTDQNVTVSGISFERISEGLPLVKWMVPFHIFTNFLRFAQVAELFQKKVKERLVRPAAKIGLTLERHISFAKNRLVVRDVLRTGLDTPMLEWLAPTSAIAVHSPSASQDWCREAEAGNWSPTSAAKTLNDRGELTVEWEWALGNDGPIVLAGSHND
jgi:hypothetical protein